MNMRSTWNHLKHIATFPKIGPDMYFTHWLLYFKPLRIWFQNRKLAHIGTGSEIRPFCTIDGTNRVFIGNNVTIPDGTRLICNAHDESSKIIIEDSVLFGPNVAVYATTHRFDDPSVPIRDQATVSGITTIRSGAWIGINSVIMPGVTVGKNSVVGSNSFVNRDVPDYTVVAGSPARVLRTLAK